MIIESQAGCRNVEVSWDIFACTVVRSHRTTVHAKISQLNSTLRAHQHEHVHSNLFLFISNYAGSCGTDVINITAVILVVIRPWSLTANLILGYF